MHLTLLLMTLAALLSGPLLYHYARPRPALLAFLDGFMLVSIAGLVLLEAVPGTFSAGGGWSLLFLLLGMLGPTALEHWLSRARREAHLLALLLAVIGLIVHSLGDGVALSDGNGAVQSIALPLAVAVHSLPVGLAVWWVLYPVFGLLPPLLAIAGMCIGTLLGYGYGPAFGAELGASGWAWFQALVAGSILHVVFGRPHIDASESRQLPVAYEGLGNCCALAGLAIVAGLEHEPLPAANALLRTLHYATLAAPWLLLVYLLTGLAVTLRPAGTQRWQQALRLACVELVDASAALVMLVIIALGLLLPILMPGTETLGDDATLWQKLCALLVVALFSGSLLRRGSRAWLADLMPWSRHGHSH